MKNVLILVLTLVVSMGVAHAQDAPDTEVATPSEVIEMSVTDKLALRSLESQVLKLQLELTQLEKTYTQKSEQLKVTGEQLSKKLDETVLQYIKESDREKYTLSPDLDLVPNE